MKLPSFLFKNLKNHSTSLGNNLAFPNEQDVPFDYKVIKKRFHKIINSLDKIGLKDISNEIEIQNYLSSLINKCREIEEPIKKQLENICEKIIQEVLDVPLDTVQLNCQLVSRIEPNKSMRLLPEDADERDFDFEDIDEIGNVNKVILKRRFINSLVLGAAHKYGTWYDLYADKLFELNKELLPLYQQIVILNDYLLFNKKEKITDKKPMQGAFVEVNLGKSGEKTEINVQGLNFILLLIETFRGFFELFASHGLPNDNNKANYIIRQSDFLLAEPWDMRFGRELWDMIDNNLENTHYVPYFFRNICELQVDEFNTVIQELLAHTKKGQMYYEEFVKDAQTDYEEYKTFNASNFDTQITKQDDVITDAYFTADELGADENILNEEGDEIINESNDDFRIQDIDQLYYRFKKDEDGREIYDITAYDADGNTIYDNWDLYNFELDDVFGEDIAYKIMNHEGHYNQYHNQYMLSGTDFNFQYEGDANDIAKEMFRNHLTEYYNGLHGYIMQDGTCIELGCDDHNTICRIPTIDDKYDFIALGNIRCSNNFIDLIQEPTYAQHKVLMKLIKNATDLSVDIYSDTKESPLTSAMYYGKSNPEIVLSQIYNFFKYGKELKGGYTEKFYEENDLYESVDKETNLETLLINTPYENIDFNEEEINIPSIGNSNKHMWVLNVICDGVAIPTELVYFRAESVYIKGKLFYQLHINVNEKLRRKGIAFKLYQAFICLFGNAISLYNNRSASFYQNNNSATTNDEAIGNLWSKLKSCPNIIVKKIKNKQGENIGDIALLKQ